MKIYLIGYMFSGKSTVGKKLAKQLNLNFFDTDDLFEKKYKIAVFDFFQKYDETSFRQLEKVILNETILLDESIIATGGGMPCFSDNMEFINNNGISIYLETNPKSILHRMQHSKQKRPILESIPSELRLCCIKEQLLLRESFYNRAHITCAAENVNIHHLTQIITNYQQNTTLSGNTK